MVDHSSTYTKTLGGGFDYHIYHTKAIGMKQAREKKGKRNKSYYRNDPPASA